MNLLSQSSSADFARNTVDPLTTVRKLRGMGVEIYFEKENIWTLDAKEYKKHHQELIDRYEFTGFCKSFLLINTTNI